MICGKLYIHRGAPGDMRIVEGSMIKNIEKSLLVLKGRAVDAYIPYHRITRIDFENCTIFERHIRPLPKKKTLH